jgi:iron(III) transport system substrate-binding protein
MLARTVSIVVMLVAVGLAGCSQPAPARGKVVLYTSVPANVIAEIETAFEQRYGALDLQIYRGGTSEVLQRVEEERKAGEIGADVIWVADFTVGEDLKEQGLLLQYTPPEAAGLLATLRDDDGYYFGARLLNMVVAYNTQALSNPPTTYWELVDARYRGRIGLASPTLSGAFLYLCGALLQNPAYGEDYFRQLGANEPAFQNNTETARRIAAGELDVGITIDFIVRNLLQDDPEAAINFTYPATGVVMVPSPIAIFRDASNGEGAKIFERFILSQEGQVILRDLAGVVPVRLDVAPPPGIESITQLDVIQADPNWIEAHHDEVTTSCAALLGEEEG